VLAGGPTAAVLDGHLGDPGRGALPLRMLAGVHALVLAGEAPALAAFYPSAGGTAAAGPGAAAAWPALREVLATRRDAIRAWLAGPPQTNEVGRGAVLAGVLCWLTARAPRPVRLVEIGASAGLNLSADRFRIEGDQASYGDPESPVRLRAAWRGTPRPLGPAGLAGPAPAELPLVDVTERTGGDVNPIDPRTADGLLRLAAYVWPDQLDRMRRLRGAADLAARVPAEVRREPASATVARVSLRPGTWTLIWHSVVRQYLDRDESRAVADGIAALAAAATDSARFCHAWLEPGDPGPIAGWPVELATWPDGGRRRIGTAAPHGLPVTWGG
jgi:hypothetical protein